MPPTSPGLSRFEYWARLQGLWELYLQLIQQPVPTGFTARELGEHAVALQEHSYTVTRAYGELIQCLELGQHIQLLDEFRSTPHQLARPDLAWARLRSVFIRKLPTSNVQITRQLANYRLQDGEGIMDYWRRGHDLRVRHQALQGAMTTLSWLTHVLAGLPSSWDPIIQIQTQLLESQTEDGLLAILLEEEERRKSRRGNKQPSDALPGEGRMSGSPKHGGQKPKWGEEPQGCPRPEEAWS